MTTKALNIRQAQVIDPILTTHAQGYTNAEMIGNELFPIAQVSQRLSKVLKFGKESFRKVNTRRAPGATKKRIQYGYGADPVAIHGHDLEAVVPMEDQEAATIPGVDLAASSVNMTLDVILLEQEALCANLASDPANYSANNKVVLAGSDKWNDPASDPEADILEYREAVRRRIGRYPNKLVLGANVFTALVTHPKIVERFKFVSSESITEMLLARLFRLDKVVIGKAVFLAEDAPDDSDAQDVWPDVAILSYVPMGAGNYRVPSFGYCYMKNGGPRVMQPYWEDSCDSWIYPTKAEYQPIMTSADAGFLVQGVL